MKIHAVIIFLLVITFNAYSQTTIEEYRYLNKGYAYQMEMGLDAQKEGYTFSDIYIDAENKVQVIGMYQAGNTNPIGMIFVFANEGSGKESYLGVPHPESTPEVMLQYEKDKTGVLTYNRKKLFETAIVAIAFNAKSSEPTIQAVPKTITTISTTKTENEVHAITEKQPKTYTSEKTAAPSVAPKTQTPVSRQSVPYTVER